MSRHPMMLLLLRGLVAVVVDPVVGAGPTLVVVLVVVVRRLRLGLVVVRDTSGNFEKLQDLLQWTRGRGCRSARLLS